MNKNSLPRPAILFKNSNFPALLAQILRTFGLLAALVCTLGQTAALQAQGNYEIQVYGSETVAPHTSMVEVHSNFAVRGQAKPTDGTAPTHHAEHETLEVTRGLTGWSELGFYVFTSEQSGLGTQWVGDHIRPRVRAPESWHWPVGVSLSTEVGYQRARFDRDTWSWELRPIIDQQKGHWYWSINPAFERSLHGPGVRDGMAFTPNVKVSYELTKKVVGGLEYYANYGDLGGILPLHEQQQQFFPAVDLNLSPKWELNFGVGVGATAATDHWMAKLIVGRHFDW